MMDIGVHLPDLTEFRKTKSLGDRRCPQFPNFRDEPKKSRPRGLAGCWSASA